MKNELSEYSVVIFNPLKVAKIVKATIDCDYPVYKRSLWNRFIESELLILIFYAAMAVCYGTSSYLFFKLIIQ